MYATVSTPARCALLVSVNSCLHVFVLLRSIDLLVLFWLALFVIRIMILWFDVCALPSELVSA